MSVRCIYSAMGICRLIILTAVSFPGMDILQFNYALHTLSTFDKYLGCFHYCEHKNPTVLGV